MPNRKSSSVKLKVAPEATLAAWMSLLVPALQPGWCVLLTSGREFLKTSGRTKGYDSREDGFQDEPLSLHLFRAIIGRTSRN